MKKSIQLLINYYSYSLIVDYRLNSGINRLHFLTFDGKRLLSLAFTDRRLNLLTDDYICWQTITSVDRRLHLLTDDYIYWQTITAVDIRLHLRWWRFYSLLKDYTANWRFGIDVLHGMRIDNKLVVLCSSHCMSKHNMTSLPIPRCTSYICVISNRKTRIIPSWTGKFRFLSRLDWLKDERVNSFCGR